MELERVCSLGGSPCNLSFKEDAPSTKQFDLTSLPEISSLDIPDMQQVLPVDGLQDFPLSMEELFNSSSPHSSPVSPFEDEDDGIEEPPYKISRRRLLVGPCACNC